MPVALSTKKLHKIGRIDMAVKDYFDKNPPVSEVQAKELMGVFIQKGIFLKDQKNGLPIHRFLRDLDREDNLQLLQNVKVVRHAPGRNWYFKK